MNHSSDNSRPSKVNILRIGAAFAPIFFFSNNALSAENFREADSHICFETKQNSIQICKSEALGFNPASLSNNYSSKNGINTDQGQSLINNYIQQPDSPTDYGSYVISILAFFASIGVPLWQRYIQKNDSKNQRLDSINEGFWIREVVMPQINTNIFSVCTAFRGKLNLSENEFTLIYRDELLPLLNELRDSFSLLKAFPNATNAIITLQQYCDDFDDTINDHINEPLNVRKSDISSFQLTLTKELMKTHKAIC